MFTHQAFVFRNERQELVTAMVSVPCQLSANSQPHGGFSYLSSNIGTPPALIPAYSYVPIQSVGRQTAAVRTNDNMIGDLFFLGPNQSQEYAYQAVGNNGVQYTHHVPVSSGHNSMEKSGKGSGAATVTTQTGRQKATSSLNAHQANGNQAAAMGSIDLPTNNVTVLQSGRVVQDLSNKNDEDNIIRNGGRKLSAARRRISSSSEEDEFFGAKIKTEDISDSEESNPPFSDNDDSPSSILSQSTQLLHGDYGAYYNVTCGDLAAQFHVSRFARGSIGKCILYERVWYTPNAFQSIAGRQCSKDWKRSIRCGQQCLRDMIREGKFQEHPKSCTCGICFSIADAVAARDLHNSRVRSVCIMFYYSGYSSDICTYVVYCSIVGM